MSEAKPGEKVVCIINTRAEDSLTIGKSYEVQPEDEDYGSDLENSYWIIDDEDDLVELNQQRFMTESEYQKLVENNTK